MSSQYHAFRRTRVSWALGLSLLFSASASAVDAVYDQLVIQARAGQTDGLLNWLHQQNQRHALNVDQVADWLQVAGWAGRDNEVVQVWQRYHSQMEIPARGVVSVARAYRNLKQWDASLALWETSLQMEPTNDDLRTGWIFTLADAGQYSVALSEAQRLVQSEPTALHYQVLAYVWRAQGKSWDALFSITKARDKDSENKAVKSDLLDAWSTNKIPAPALSLSRTMNLPAEDTRRLELNAAAELVRLADLPSRGEAERFQVADRALARYDQLLNQWQSIPEAQDDCRLARLDRLGALLARKRFAEVVSEYESLKADGKPMPDYIDGWVASALLSLQRPEEAFRLFSKAPAHVEAEMFYAAIESEDFPAAKGIVDRMIANTPYQIYDYGSPVPEPNDRWLTSRILLSHYLSATNDLPVAEKLSEHLANTAPGNQELRINNAAVLAARGLPHAAEQELKRAEVLEPSSLSLESQQAYVAQSLQEWRQFELLTDDVVARSPEEPSTQQLARTRDIRHMYELRISGNKGISSDSPISGSHDFTWNSALYGPPIAEHWRPFAGFNFATGEFEEGKGYNRDVLGGVEFTARDYWAEAELSNQNFGDGNKLGARFSAWHDFNDHWRLGGSAERLSSGTPLRALRNGVTANGGQAYVRWYQNERREYQLTIAPSWFSDGNQRMEYGLSGKERLWTTPRFTLDLTPDLSASTNTKEDVPYYNPKSDFSATPGLSAEHIIYRHYDTVWSQQITGGVGAYWQKDHGTGLVTQLGYGQRVQWNNVLDAGLMLTWDKRPYDGDRERNLGVSFDMNVRF
ncbi:poly-beta-1,6 N-acetyl-D-glucosamine export porin PgaA [Scandinavium sp. H11S7]|uniref:Poly-beta-1,6 N-acetyl-D-glucosamine export porin PgaA n=1 Tax=Scandinavium hiltneri TaxID=2926519 RepID=A0ABT2E7S3_9ENTR|nr:poly-beta-1,6 N-acetyl-D-glucosamine export porin PgaA [Scandinavium hiltneri]MCS2163929.1 poly-beta-1,6 N-acetyl-D-glucosamine export porin PgaA [Scandinavium hiltneri]